MDEKSLSSVRRAIRCLLIMEASASDDGGKLSRAELVQVVRAQCSEARQSLRRIARSASSR